MTRIITDTTSCLLPEVAEKYQIPVIPQVINFGNESLLEGIDIDIPTFMQRLRSSPELPKTAAPPPKLFVEAFERLLPLGEPILCIHPSADVSGTVRSAQIAAANFPDAPIHILDTRLVASPLGTLVELAAQWAAQGLDVETIKTRLMQKAPHCRIYFLVAPLEYLQRGGRIGGAQALLGGLLQIKPILTFREGKVDQFERQRTYKHALTRLKELVVTEYAKNGAGYLSIMQGGALEQAETLAEELRQQLKLERVTIHNMPPAIVTHAGPGILAAGFFVQ